MLKAFEDMLMEGKAEGRIEDILDLLKELGQVPQTIVELMRQKMT